MVANLCEKTQADAEVVLKGMGLDNRIGRSFLSPGVGFGGSCFPKDISAFISLGKNYNYDFDLLKAVKSINQQQVNLFVEKVEKSLGNLKGKHLAVLGISFKPNTDDIREAPSIKIIHQLLQKGAKIKAYDPIAVNNAKKILPKEVIFTTDPYNALSNSQALLLITEWNEFKELDLEKVKKIMAKPVIIDGRNIYDPQKVKLLGFTYQGIGRS